MITSERGNIKIKGSASEILTDLTCAIQGVVKTLSEDTPREEVVGLVQEAFELGVMEKEKCAEYLKEQIVEKLFELLGIDED